MHEGGPFEQIETDVGMLWMQTSDEVMRPYLLRRRTWEESTAALLAGSSAPVRGSSMSERTWGTSASSHTDSRWDIQIDAVEPHPVTP